MRARIIDQGLMCLIRSIDSNMADLGLHITLLPISRQALPSSAATCQNQLLVLQIGLCLFLYVFPVFELLSVLFCSVLLCLGRESKACCRKRALLGQPEPGLGRTQIAGSFGTVLTTCQPVPEGDEDMEDFDDDDDDADAEVAALMEWFRKQPVSPRL